MIHQKYGTSEYSHLLEELPSLRARYGEDILTVMAPAIDAFRKTRRRVLTLYPTVADTLAKLKEKGVRIAAFADSKAFYTNYRFRKLGLDGLVDVLYSPRDHSVPDETVATQHYDADSYAFTHTAHHYTPEGEVKPNPDVLLDIVKDLAVSIDEVVYVATIRSRTYSWRSRPASRTCTPRTGLANTSPNMSYCVKSRIGRPRWWSESAPRSSPAA